MTCVVKPFMVSIKNMQLIEAVFKHYHVVEDDNAIVAIYADESLKW